MKQGTKKWMSLLALAVSGAIALSGCSKSNSGSESSPANSQQPTQSAATDAPKEETVNLVWYFPNDPQKDIESVQEAVNKITKEKINATVTLKTIPLGDYEQKMNTYLAAGDNFDIAWTSNWSFNYVLNVTKGAFMPLDDLIAKNAPGITETLPKFILDATRVGGKIYGVPNYQTVTNREGVLVQKVYADKYNLDASQIKSLKDLEPFLEQVKQGEPDKIPMAMTKGGMFASKINGIEMIQSGNVGVYLNDPYKAVNIRATPEYKEYLSMIRDWYTKGYVNKDAPMVNDMSEIVKTGNAVVTLENVMAPDITEKTKLINGGNEVIAIHFTPPYTSTGSIITTMQAINAKSKHPDKAMAFINLLTTDKELYNTLVYGIEGKHYTKAEGDKVQPIKDSGYDNSGYSWVLGNTFNAFLIGDETKEMKEAILEENNSAEASPLMGFSFVGDNIKTESSALNALGDEYAPGLNTGAVDPNKVLPEYLNKMETAGVQKVIEEVQRQIDEWKQANGK